MKIVGIGLSHNEADVIKECVTSALQWVDAFVLYDNSTDGTAEIARDAGAVVLPGYQIETFSEHLRQATLSYAKALHPDWIVRIDPDEFYPAGAGFTGDEDKFNLRQTIEIADSLKFLSLRVPVIQFWVTLDDIRRGFLLENEEDSVIQRRHWYSVGHSAVVAWKHDPALAYPLESRKNIPFYPDGRDVGQAKLLNSHLVQLHYPFRGFTQMARRIAHRKNMPYLFGKYRENVILDEAYCGLHHWDGVSPFERRENHDWVYKWFELSRKTFEGR